MAKRIKKPIVREDKRREWLRRHDQGESLPAIAAKDQFDIRTVRRQVAKAAAEHDMKEARQAVLREALVKHFSDLVDLAEKISTMVSTYTPVVLEPREEQLLEGLRQHVPRSAIWTYMNRWEKLLQEQSKNREKVDEKLSHVKQLFSEIAAIVQHEPKNPLPRIRKALAYQVECWSTGAEPLDVKSDFKMLPLNGTVVDVYYGPTYLGNMNNETAQKLRELIPKMEQQVSRLEEVSSLRKIHRDLLAVRDKLMRELSVFVLRRVLPGRCLYCPI